MGLVNHGTYSPPGPCEVAENVQRKHIYIVGKILNVHDIYGPVWGIYKPRMIYTVVVWKDKLLI